MRFTRRAFTIIEVLLVLTIIGMLMGLVFVAAGPAREAARQRGCASNLQQIGQALAMYRADYDGVEAVAGHRMQYWQLGLPGGGQAVPFEQQYVKNMQVLHCPSDHEPSRKGSTYRWCPDDDQYYPAPVQFGLGVEKQGDRVVIAYCDQHNTPYDIATAPRWLQLRMIVLRLNGQVETKEVPVIYNTTDW